MESSSHNIKAMALNLSAYGQFFFFGGNVILPVVLWSLLRKDDRRLDNHGRNVLNFQLSLYTYAFAVLLFAVPALWVTVLSTIPFDALFNDYHVVLHAADLARLGWIGTIALFLIFLFAVLYVISLILILVGSVKALNGEFYTYPLSIRYFPLIKEAQAEEGAPQAEPVIEPEP